MPSSKICLQKSPHFEKKSSKNPPSYGWSPWQLDRDKISFPTRIMIDNLPNYEFCGFVGSLTLNSSIYNWSLTLYSTNRKRKSLPAPRESLHITALIRTSHSPKRPDITVVFCWTVNHYQYVDSCWIVLERSLKLPWENTVNSFFVC